MSDETVTAGEREWHEGGDGHGYRYQYIGPIHYLCECGDHFLNRDRWMFHKGVESARDIPPAGGAGDDLRDGQVPPNPYRAGQKEC